MQVLKWLHSEECRVSRNARNVAVALGFEMGADVEAAPGIKRLMVLSHSGSGSVLGALEELRGPTGVLDRTKRGQGKADLYRLKNLDGQQSKNADGAENKNPEASGFTGSQA